MKLLPSFARDRWPVLAASTVITIQLCLLCAVPYATGQSLELNTIINRALQHSHEIQLSRIDIDINKGRLDEGKSMYYPKLSFRLTNEYLHDLNSGDDSVVSVGDSVISSSDSTFQHSLSFYADYNLFDFGIRDLQYTNLTKEVEQAHFNLEQKTKDIKVEILNLYTEGLKTYHQLNANQKIIECRKKIYDLTTKLVQAGQSGSIKLGEAAISVAESVRFEDDLRIQLSRLLEKLSFYTGEPYQADDTSFSALSAKNHHVTDFEIEQMPEIKALELEIDKKLNEIKIVEKKFLPKFTFYSSYRFYGNDRSNYLDSINDIHEKNITTGVVAEIDLFNGFKDEAEVKRLNSELKRLATEKDRRIAGIESTIRSLIKADKIYEATLNKRKSYSKKLKDQNNAQQRLADQQILDKVAWLIQKTEMYEKELQVEFADIDRKENLIRLSFLKEQNNTNE